AAELVQPGVLGADSGVVETGGNRMGVADLPGLALPQVGTVAVQHARRAAGQGGAVQPGLDAVAAGLDADHSDSRFVEKRMEEPHRVRAATDAGDESVGQPAFALFELHPRLVPDD